MTRIDEQLEFLLSRIGDADLSADERAAIRRAVEGDAACARLADEYRRLGDTLRAYRPLPRRLDWAALSAGVVDRLVEAAEADASAVVDRTLDPAALGPDTADAVAFRSGDDALAGEYAAVQDMLREWARPLPPVDWEAFRSGVSRQIRREVLTSPRPAARSRLNLFVNWVAPLAAAAAIVLAVAWPREPIGQVPGEGGRAASNIVVVVDLPAESGNVQFSYDESFVEEERADEEPSVKAIAVGPSAREWREHDDEEYMH